MDISLALTWILFLALFPVSYFWLRRAWRIIVRRDYSEVALKHGEPPPNPEKFAPCAAAVNLIGGCITVGTILLVVVGMADYNNWTAIAGSTLWMKSIADFILRSHAHPFWGKRNSKAAAV